MIDIRLNNSSQLAGFAKQQDLAFFLRELCGAEYVHVPLLAPTQELLDAYKKSKGSWAAFERGFLALLAARNVGELVDKALFREPAALLCSEPAPGCCHRRLVAEYLDRVWGNMRITHL